MTAPAPLSAILFSEPPVVPMIPAASMSGFFNSRPDKVSESINAQVGVIWLKE